MHAILFFIAAILSRAGNTVDLLPFKDWNIVELWVNGEKIFNCDIRNLDYGDLNSSFFCSDSIFMDNDNNRLIDNVDLKA